MDFGLYYWKKSSKGCQEIGRVKGVSRWGKGRGVRGEDLKDPMGSLETKGSSVCKNLHASTDGELTTLRGSSIHHTPEAG